MIVLLVQLWIILVRERDESVSNFVFFNEIFELSRKSDEMKRSDSICTGLRAFPWNERKIWKGQINLYDPCVLAGLTVIHQYQSPGKLRQAFLQTRRADLALKLGLQKFVHENISF